MAHECPDCSRVERKPVFVGKFTMPNWVGHSGFYLFKCQKCESVNVDYPPGYTAYGLLYLQCDNCKEMLVLEVTDERDLYEREEVHIPLSTFEKREKELKNMIADIENQGVKVILADASKCKTKKRSILSIFGFKS